jgi:hypothetical protein
MWFLKKRGGSESVVLSHLRGVKFIFSGLFNYMFSVQRIYTVLWYDDK